jgi:uncharacterized caspase-like protein
MRWLPTLIVGAAAIFCSLHPAAAEKRVALVIGNSGYVHAPRLENPAKDAAAITELFRQAKFDVIETRRDLGIVEMRRALRELSDKSRDADIAVVYYAGHGIEVEGSNYLIPTDAILERDRDAFDEAILLDRVLQAVEPAKQLRLVILDACRENPFNATMRRTVASRSIGRGLAAVEPPKANTLIAFAAKSGSTASDGSGANSPFTSALLKHLTTPGLDLRKAFGLVRDDVMRATNDRQEPFVYGSLGGTDVSLVPAPVMVTPPKAGADEQAAARRDYEFTLQLGTKDGWASFLQQYPTGFYAGLARGQLAKIAAEEQRQAATEKVQRAEAEKARLAEAGAKGPELASAGREAKAAKEARIAAETLKQNEDAKADEAEQQRIPKEKADAEKLARETATAEGKSRETSPQTEDGVKVAALPPASPPLAKPESLNRQLQVELRRLGCLTATVNDEWTPATRRALQQFNSRAGMKLDVNVASTDALDIVRGRAVRVCPLVCRRGYRASGERCVEIVCGAGFRRGDDGSCERIARPRQERAVPEKKTVLRPPPKIELPTAKPRHVIAKPVASPAPQASGQIICTKTGCKPVSSGCKIVGNYNFNTTLHQHEQCN